MAEFDAAQSPYAGAKVALLTQHGKERVFAPLFREMLAARIELVAGFDARFLNETEVMAKVVDALMLGVTVSVLHDTQPPEGVVPTDLRVFTVLRFSFDVAPAVVVGPAG